MCDGMMVDGRNQKRLADLNQTPAAKEAGLSAAEIVAVRLYSGEDTLACRLTACCAAFGKRASFMWLGCRDVLCKMSFAKCVFEMRLTK